MNRLSMILAVLEKRCHINLGTQDVYINVIGGIRIDEPAVDLAVAMAIVSSYKNIVIDNKTVFIGEVGLTGEIRSINQFEKRVKEVEKMGYQKIIGNCKQIENLKKENTSMTIQLVGIGTIEQAINQIIENG